MKSWEPAVGPGTVCTTRPHAGVLPTRGNGLYISHFTLFTFHTHPTPT